MTLTVLSKDDRICFEGVKDVWKKGTSIEFYFGEDHIVRIPADDVKTIYWEEVGCEIYYG